MDFCKNFGKFGLFYEEFLKNRDTRGIHDLVYLGLLPKLNIYRPDLIPSDLSLSRFPTLNVAAVLLTTPIWIMLATWVFCSRTYP